MSQAGRAKQLSIEVSNRPAPEHLAELEATVAGVTSPEDADEASRLRVIASVLRGEGSGLGLARIRAEAAMSLCLTIDGTWACVEAVTTFERGSRS